MPVNSFGPRLRGLTWCHRCSSTPRQVTPANRDSSAAARARIGSMLVHTVRHVVANCRASPATLACSRRTCSVAHRHALVVSMPAAWRPVHPAR